MTYRIRVRGNPAWKAKPRCILAISVGQPYHEGAKLHSVIEWINLNYQECIIDVSDTLQRYNNPLFIENVDAAHTQALQEGDTWIRRNTDILKTFTIPYRIIRWDYWLQHELYSQLHNEMQNLYENDLKFKQAVDDDISKFLERRNDLSIEQKIIAINNSRGFIIEECAAQTLLAREYPGAKVYPSHQLKALALLRNNSLLKAPQGLSNESYVRINFERKHAA